MSDRVVIALADDGVADVRLNRADKLNALDAEMFEALVAAGDGLARERGPARRGALGRGARLLRRARLRGLPPDARSPAARPARDLFERRAASPANHAQRAAWVWQELPGAGDRRAPRRGLRRRPPDRPRRRRPHRRPGRTALGARAPLGPRAGHERHADAPPPGARRRRAGAHLHRAHRERQRGGEPRPRDARRARARARTPSPWPGRSRRTRRTPCARRSGCSKARSRATSPRACASRRSCQRSLLGRPNQVEAVRANLEQRPPKFRDPE